VLGFSDNMNYEKRSELRKECSMFLRFSYLADFLAMEALSNLFKYSVQELESQIEQYMLTDEVDIAMMSQGQKVLEHEDPLFLIQLQPNFEEVDAKEIVEEVIEEFLLPPFGESKPADFNILYHIRNKQPRRAEELEESDSDEGVVYNEDYVRKQFQRRVVPRLTQL